MTEAQIRPYNEKPQQTFIDLQKAISTERIPSIKNSLLNDREQMLEEATPYTTEIDTFLANAKTKLLNLKNKSDEYTLTIQELDEWGIETLGYELTSTPEEPMHLQGISNFLLEKGQEYLANLEEDLELRYYSSKRKEELDDAAVVSIKTPENFSLTEQSFEAAIAALDKSNSESIQGLLDRNINYSFIEPVDPGSISIQEVVGTRFNESWRKVIESTHPDGATTALSFAARILDMPDYERREFFDDVHISMHTLDAGHRRFFVDGNGRHRMSTLKALEAMGCEIKISNAKVSQLGKNK